MFRFLITVLPPTIISILIWATILLGLILFVFGVWFKGSHDNEMSWKNRAAKYEERIKIAEAQAGKINTVIQKETEVKVQKVKDVQTVIKEKIQVVEKVINEKCQVDPAAIELLNNAVNNEIPTTPTTSVPMKPENTQ